MKELFLVIFLSFICSNSQSSETISAKLSFTPYSSSYLSLRDGQLFFGDYGFNNNRDSIKAPIDRGNNEPPKNLNEAMYEKLPLIDRFENIRRKALHKKERSRVSYARHLFNPDAEGWEGVCDQWSGASLEKELSNLLTNMDPIYCEGITINPSEVRELFTAFYNHKKHSEFLGVRNRDKSNARIVGQLENFLGVDDLPADLFHTKVYETLSADKGFVMDLSNSTDVWNQPVYEASSVISTKENITSLSSDFLGKIPMDILESPDPNVQKELDVINNSQASLFKTAEKLSNRKGRKPHFFEKISASEEAQLGREIIAMTKRIDKLPKEKIQIKNGYRLKEVETTLTYANESSFSRGATDSRNRQVMRNYFLIEKNGKPYDAKWLSSPHERPDFLWIPDQQIVKNKVYKKYSEEMDDLLEILNSCKSAGSLASFYETLNSAASDKFISDTEKKALLSLWPEVKSKVDLSWMHQVLSKADGLRVDEFSK